MAAVWPYSRFVPRRLPRYLVKSTCRSMAVCQAAWYRSSCHRQSLIPPTSCLQMCRLADIDAPLCERLLYRRLGGSNGCQRIRPYQAVAVGNRKRFRPEGYCHNPSKPLCFLIIYNATKPRKRHHSQTNIPRYKAQTASRAWTRTVPKVC